MMVRRAESCEACKFLDDDDDIEGYFNMVACSEFPAGLHVLCC